MIKRQPSQFDADGKSFRDLAEARQAMTDHARGIGEWARRDNLTLGIRHELIESRALSIGTASADGYTVANTMFPLLIARMKYVSGLFDLGERVAAPYGVKDFAVATCDDVAVAGALVAKNATRDAVTDLTFGQLVLNSFMFSSRLIRVSVELDRDWVLDTEAIAGLLGARIARALNPYLTTGTGTAQPQGIVTGASDSGLTLAGGSPTADELIDLIGSLDPEYQFSDRLAVVTAPPTLTSVLKALDGATHSLYEPRQPGQRFARFGGAWLVPNPDMPVGTSAKVAVAADLSRFFIRVEDGLLINRVSERFAELGQVGYMAHLRVDSGLADAAAAKYCTSAA